MAMALLNQDDLENALKHARASVELFDQFPAAISLYAGLLFAKGEKEAAKQQLARLRVINPNMSREFLSARMGYSLGLKIEQEESFNRLLDEAGFIDEPSAAS